MKPIAAFTITRRLDDVYEVKSNGNLDDVQRLGRLLFAAPDLYAAVKLAKGRIDPSEKNVVALLARNVGRTDYSNLLDVLNSVINDVEGL